MSLQVFATNKMLGTRILATNKVGSIENSNRLKCVKPKTERSECQKLSKSKKLSKSRNLPKFDVKKNGPNFLTPSTRETFNRLQLIFTKVPIVQYLDLESHI